MIPPDSLVSMQRRLLRGMLVILLLLGLPALAVACLEAVRLDQLSGIFLYGSFYLVVFFTALSFERLPFGFSAGVMLACLYLISLFNLVHFSFGGAGIEIFLTLSVLATVLLGIPLGLATAGICLVSILGVGMAFVYGVIDVTPGMPATTGQLISWITASAVFSLLSGALILSSGMVQQHLIRSVKTVQQQADDLSMVNENLSEEIGQRTQAEDRLKQSELQFRTLFEMAPDAFYLTDLEGKFLDGNKAAETLMGVSREKFIGKSFQTLHILPRDQLPLAFALLEKNIRGEKTGPDELDLKSRSLGEIVVEIHTCPFELNGQRVILGIARDVSERKKLEAHFNQARKMESIGRLAGGVAHDFNNMLSIIIGNTELALEQAPPGHPLHQALNEIFNAANRSAVITRQLLGFARRQAVAPRALDLNRTVEAMLDMLRRLIGENINLSWHPAPDLWLVKIDPSQVDQILVNLCVNARDAIGDVGRIIIETRMTELKQLSGGRQEDFIPGDFVVLAVSDTGCGMDKQTLANLFEPFFTTKDLGKGTGLGLATVYGIVRQNSGVIHVNSSPGNGSSFEICLPRYLSDADTVSQQS